MADPDDLLEELVTANRILAREGVVDSFGHISVRHPQRTDRFLLSRSRAPEQVEADDIMTFALDGNPTDESGRRPYLERFIHGAIYEARPDVSSVVHSHSLSVIPFSVTGQALRPLMHVCAPIGYTVPVWDSRSEFGDTDLLVSNLAMGRDLARALGQGRTALMRGHGSVVATGSIRESVYTAIYLERNAGLQTAAMGMGPITFLSPGEVERVIATTTPALLDRLWENWCRHAGRRFLPQA